MGRASKRCMISSIPQAREGTLYLMCAGKQETFARARSLLESLSKTVCYIGPAGEAAKVKVPVNMVMNMDTAALAKGFGVGQALRRCYFSAARTRQKDYAIAVHVAESVGLKPTDVRNGHAGPILPSCRNRQG